MNILDLTERIAGEADLGLPFTIFRGNERKPIDPEEQSVSITLANIPQDVLPSPLEASYFDFTYKPSEKTIYCPTTELLKEHRTGKILRKLNQVMETVGKEIGATRIEARNVVNQKLVRIMPRFGYVSLGYDGCGGYSFEKRI